MVMQYRFFFFFFLDACVVPFSGLMGTIVSNRYLDLQKFVSISQWVEREQSTDVCLTYVFRNKRLHIRLTAHPRQQDVSDIDSRVRRGQSIKQTV